MYFKTCRYSYCYLPHWRINMPLFRKKTPTYTTLPEEKVLETLMDHVTKLFDAVCAETAGSTIFSGDYKDKESAERLRKNGEPLKALCSDIKRKFSDEEKRAVLSIPFTLLQRKFSEGISQETFNKMMDQIIGGKIKTLSSVLIKTFLSSILMVSGDNIKTASSCTASLSKSFLPILFGADLSSQKQQAAVDLLSNYILHFAKSNIEQMSPEQKINSLFNHIENDPAKSTEFNAIKHKAIGLSDTNIIIRNAGASENKQDLIVKQRQKCVEVISNLITMLESQDPEMYQSAIGPATQELLISHLFPNPEHDEALTRRYANVINWTTQYLEQHAMNKASSMLEKRNHPE